MDVTDLLEPLNDAQRTAVAAPPGPLLVVAGAGSGKTRVLAHRIAYLIRTGQASPGGVLAVTFTNKAAREMRERIAGLLGIPVHGMWVGTFHGLAHRLLRAHWQTAGLPEQFQIIDSDDQHRAIRRVLKDLEIDEARWAPKQVQWFINAQKDEGLRPENLDDQGDVYQRQMNRIYAAYQAMCERAGMVDFAELLLRAHELWRDHAEVLTHYQRRFGHVLVDEFQDTNSIQYAWLQLLTRTTGQLFAVGDDDQSIYGWRGAKIENIQRFSHDYPGTQIVRLEQNYRSTANILAAANALIARNADRLGKDLWTAGSEGPLISLYGAFNDLEEARYIVQTIQHCLEQGMARHEIAVLYRSNAQSRVLEEALLQSGIPYRVYGGMRFFERAEIKDALAYLRLAANRDQDAAFERVVNTPTRGIGERTLQAVRDYARTHQVSLWAAASAVAEAKAVTARAANALRGFQSLIDRLADDIQGLVLSEQVEHVIAHSGLLEHYRADRSEKGRMRTENLEELVTAAGQFHRDEDDPEDDLTAFLVHAALEAGEAQGDEWQDCVQLMTLHSAKGLEFATVFIAGMEEGLFPHQRSIEEPGRLEEERRLCYVGMTRAKQQLYLSYAELRRLHGAEAYTRVSRFVREIPPALLNEVRLRGSISRPGAVQAPLPDAEEGGLRLGQRVAHAKFGEGVVMNQEGSGSHARVQVNFEATGSKWLVAAYANLRVL